MHEQGPGSPCPALRPVRKPAPSHLICPSLRVISVLVLQPDIALQQQPQQPQLQQSQAGVSAAASQQQQQLAAQGGSQGKRHGGVRVRRRGRGGSRAEARDGALSG